MLKKVGKESKFVNGLRYTDEETINIVQMVLCGLPYLRLYCKQYRPCLPQRSKLQGYSPFRGVSEVPYLKKQGIISGGMIPKIDCCVEAVRRGVKKANIIDADNHSTCALVCKQLYKY